MYNIRNYLNSIICRLSYLYIKFKNCLHTIWVDLKKRLCEKPGTLEVELIKIASAIKYLNQAGGPFVLQFTSSDKNEGVNIITKKFANAAASLGMGPCLVIDCNKDPSGFSKNEDQKLSIVQSIEFEHSLSKAVWKNKGEDEISFAKLIDDNENWSKAYQLDLNQIFNEAKKQYKCIIIESPPFTQFPESGSLSLYSDATILVVASDTTAQSVIVEVKNAIINAGGNIIGLIFNQRNAYISTSPDNRLIGI